MSILTTAELFERGKTYFDNEKFDEALKDFLETVRLEPQNSDYHAWLARTFVAKNDYTNALSSANQAIQLNPLCQLAYRQRAAVYRNNKDYQKALQDYSKAIELDPQDWIAFNWRGQVYWELKDYENALMDNFQYYRLYSENWEIEEFSGNNPKFQAWHKAIHQHFTKNIFPRFKNGDENYVRHLPCAITWGERSDIRSNSGNAYTMTSLSYGTGYICLTNKNIYLFSFGQISQQFPLFDTGFFKNVLAIGLGKIDRRLEKTDQTWAVPYKTVNGVQKSNETLHLVTPAMTWEIYEHFTGDLQVILEGINLGMSGRYDARETAPTIQPANTNIIELLKQLGDLKSQGIITEAEFETKKKELLTRL